MRHWLAPLVLCSALAAAADLQGYTEEFPPFNYLDKGAPAGLANDILDRVMARSGLSIERSSLPWPRAVQMTASSPNSLLYTTVRTPAREAQYRWVGPYDDCDVVLIKLRSRKDLQIGKLEDARNYLVGAVRGAAASQLLQEKQFPARNLTLVSDEEAVLRMLFAGRTDLNAGMFLPHGHLARQLGLPAQEMEVAHILQKGGGCYFAFNSKVDPALFARFEKAFEALRSSGELQQLQLRHGGRKGS
ncbi:substrate-binding periplasmic protein [Chitinilyticum piscinae]|uniref:Transporter substrate-binding domain-containing protein n=1 Tax=Chitinilyticum piscinae TaxID=2866724 RepID=A0A8J7FSB9_9NEIS|nr:transporter substrate-binding domain-containing protein [Chitinilyticum piscinae]MBE9609801.1 transporter substrate-binding domain-containing protein [Chitinilyticum piscinae]